MIYLRYGGEKNEKANQRETTIYWERWKVFRVIVYAEMKKLDCWRRRQIYKGICAVCVSILYSLKTIFIFRGSLTSILCGAIFTRGLRISRAQFRRVMPGRRSPAIRHEGCVSLAINPTGTYEGCACVRKYTTHHRQWWRSTTPRFDGGGGGGTTIYIYYNMHTDERTTNMHIIIYSIKHIHTLRKVSGWRSAATAALLSRLYTYIIWLSSSRLHTVWISYRNT